MYANSNSNADNDVHHLMINTSEFTKRKWMRMSCMLESCML